MVDVAFQSRKRGLQWQKSCRLNSVIKTLCVCHLIIIFLKPRASLIKGTMLFKGSFYHSSTKILDLHVRCTIVNFIFVFFYDCQILQWFFYQYQILLWFFYQCQILQWFFYQCQILLWFFYQCQSLLWFSNSVRFFYDFPTVSYSSMIFLPVTFFPWFCL